MLQRLPKALAQVKASNNSQILLNEIKQIVYSLYQSKDIIDNVLIININIIDTIFFFFTIFFYTIKIHTIFMNAKW